MLTHNAHARLAPAANTGGLLGLFTGFSVISLVEIFYYVSLRLWCDVKRRAEERRRREGGVN